MFDHEGVKTESDLKSFNPLFTCQNKKIGHQKNVRLKDITYIIPNNLKVFKIYSTTFKNEFSLLQGTFPKSSIGTIMEIPCNNSFLLPFFLHIGMSLSQENVRHGILLKGNLSIF